MSQSFFTQRFYLDTPSDRYTRRGGENFVGPFRSFWVSNTNNSNFECDLVINPRNEMGARGIPLRLNQCQSIESKPEGACIEFKTAQPGVWIDITFAQDDKLQIGSIVLESSGFITLSEGSNHSSTRVDVPNGVVTEVITASDKRAVSSLQLKSGGTFWIGNPTELNNADWKNICKQVTLSPLENMEWRNSAALNIKTDAGALVFSRFDEVI